MKLMKYDLKGSVPQNPPKPFIFPLVGRKSITHGLDNYRASLLTIYNISGKSQTNIMELTRQGSALPSLLAKPWMTLLAPGLIHPQHGLNPAG